MSDKPTGNTTGINALTRLPAGWQINVEWWNDDYPSVHIPGVTQTNGGRAAMRKPPRDLPICSATVEILGSHWPQTSTIWAGLQLHEATVREIGAVGPRHRLAVPWCHINDISDGEDDAVYALDAKDERYRFVRAANGAWVLRLLEQ